ncbi:hypothetical protein ABZV67_10680 [Streptomyces sp. NPDC005065]|uniref:hypothetical protein n=1 Tax=Streptomyces sp. NPDC005065 TaxID=3154461 RepID=UPI0033A263D2
MTSTDPLSILAPYIDIPPHPSDELAAALRIAGARIAGRTPLASDVLLFDGNTTAMTRAISDQVYMPANSARVDVYGALDTLAELLDL